MSFTTRIPLIFGGGGIGAPGSLCKVTDTTAAQLLLDTFFKHGPAAIDTSNIYGGGSSEPTLASLNLHGSRIDTKIYPMKPGDHAPTRLKELFQNTLKALKDVKIRVFYMHAPDRTVPFEETLGAINDLYKEGHFEQFGLSNYLSFEVAEIIGICKAKGYVLPTVYEGLYNPIDRTIEAELIPCLRKNNIKFAAYCPLAGGFMVGLYLDEDAIKNIEPGSHYDPKMFFSVYFTKKYFPMIGAVRELRAVAEKHGLNLNQASVRWLQHHSALIPSDLGIIYGGSKPSHVERTLAYNGEGPLPDEVVQAFEDCYSKVKGGLPNYNHSPKWYDPKVHGY